MLFGPEHQMEMLLWRGWERRPRRFEVVTLMVRAVPPLAVVPLVLALLVFLSLDPFHALGSAQMILKFSLFVGGIWGGMRLGFMLQRGAAYLFNRRMLRQNEDLLGEVIQLRSHGLSGECQRHIMLRHPFGI